MKLITIVKEGEPIDKALKKYKKKINKLNLIKVYRDKLFYLKPSIKKRINFFKKKYFLKKNEKK
ncbi:MAG: 30S ribosomal protein S21 [Candidatus Shikimatogenerans bostrichidophilus]|nr:MAG: 30S ribosomal protein S21 [Candidatus Shikimatogenerans bostrichidophilus]